MSDAAAKPVRLAPPAQSSSAHSSDALPSEFTNLLARAMANQLNNIMMAVTSEAELELKKATPAARPGLEHILSNAARATSLIQKLLAFSRKRTLAPRPVRLNSFLTQTSGWIHQLCGEQMEVTLYFDPEVQRVKADQVDLERWLLGLALDPAATGSNILIATQSTILGAEQLAPGQDASPGRYVVLEVEVSRAKHAEEPECPHVPAEESSVAASTGIEAIAREAGGFVRVSEGPGSRRCFKVYFPALGAEEADERAPWSPKTTPSATILIVEDDDAVRKPAAEFLKMEGFKILQARTGPEALLVALRNRSALDLLITDVVMPQMTGHEVAAKLLEMHPDLKVLYMSGDTNQTLPGQIVEEARHTALLKPFSLNTLYERIREVLEK